MASRAPFPRVFWVANSIEILERFAYYGIYFGFGIYMASLGYEVFRIPDHNGFHPQDPAAHFTYTNAFRVNDRIFITSFGEGDPSFLDEDEIARRTEVERRGVARFREIERDPDRYLAMPEGKELAALQAEGQLPKQMPSAELPTLEYLKGFSLELFILMLLVWAGIKRLFWKLLEE